MFGWSVTKGFQQTFRQTSPETWKYEVHITFKVKTKNIPMTRAEVWSKFIVGDCGITWSKLRKTNSCGVDGSNSSSSWLFLGKKTNHKIKKICYPSSLSLVHKFLEVFLFLRLHYFCVFTVCWLCFLLQLVSFEISGKRESR